MLNNIGLPGLLLILLIVVLPIWLIMRSSKRKANEQARIADALEDIAKSKKNSD
ncbi:hypothetical protein [Roseobacter litoralis]|uniref:hypothetical protein n=1 Tax=Roseobacter litoralis TaxID=42443 RepID=UPI000160F106|nr:hypothetical protein [Roseobacter litoralis]